MNKARIYLDTSAIGGLFDDKFEEGSKALFARFYAGDLAPLVSDLTLAELVGAPQRVKDAYKSLHDFGLVVLLTTAEASNLASQYEAMNVLTAKSKNDMLHIAIATIARVDAIVSWNFKHIVNFDKMHLFNAVNLSQGYVALAIHSPLEFAK